MGMSRILAFAAILALPGAAMAHMEPSKAGRSAFGTFKALDRNGDGGLSSAELHARGREKGSDALFILLDGDGDGRLSLKELGRSGPVLGRFQAYDVNKDGFVRRNEFPNFLDPVLLTALDRNGDGVIALVELRPAFAGTRLAEAPPKQRSVKAAPVTKPAAYCWIPGFGDGKWMLEGPVSWTRCRVS